MTVNKLIQISKFVIKTLLDVKMVLVENSNIIVHHKSFVLLINQ